LEKLFGKAKDALFRSSPKSTPAADAEGHQPSARAPSPQQLEVAS
jgi:hypothetical protein